MVNLKAIVVHQVNKVRGGTATLVPRDALLPITDTERHFITNVREVYYKKSNPIYGVFDSNIVSFPYQNILQKYLDDECNFLSFTIDAMEHFRSIINDVHQATGGYVVFAHFDDVHEFIIAIVLNNKRQYNINDTLSIEKIFSLDIDKLDVANFVNVDRWRDGSETYLSFARGRKDVSLYFKNFIGCTDQISSREQSKRLKKALLAFLDTLDISNSLKEEKRNQVYNYCMEKIKQSGDISLSHISSILDNDNPDSFQHFASSEEFQVSSTIRGHRQALKNLKFYVYRSKDLTIEFDSALMSSNRIVYDQEQNELIIKNVPDDLRQQILNVHASVEV